MTAYLAGLEGTEAGHTAALILALMAAVLHAIFGALQKGRFDPWLSRAAIDGCYALIAAPFALFVVPWPEPWMWPWTWGWSCACPEACPGACTWGVAGAAEGDTVLPS